MGVHAHTLAQSLVTADAVYMYRPPELSWSLEDVIRQIGRPAWLMPQTDEIVNAVVASAQPGDHILIMSNGGFDNIHEKLIAKLRSADK